MIMANCKLRALLLGVATAAAALFLAAGPAWAGTVLLARESTIRATGKAGSADFDLTDGSHDFNGFSNLVDTADAGVSGPRVSANQHSRPSMSASGDDFTGAYAEGSANAAANNPGSNDAQAESNFDLTFQVVGSPSIVNFGGAVGVNGNGSTTIALQNKSTHEVLLQQELFAGDGEGQSLDHQTVLSPGVYELSVNASVDGEHDDSMAYFTVSLSISPVATGGIVTPVPLPSSAWSALAVLAAGGLVQGYRKIRRGVLAV
jgi:hypothetical protein